MLRCVEVYKEMYKKDPLDVSFTPYRICPIGAHSDHQLGKITGLAIDKGIHIAYSAKTSGIVELTSLQFGKRAQFHVNNVPSERLGRLSPWCNNSIGKKLSYQNRYECGY